MDMSKYMIDLYENHEPEDTKETLEIEKSILCNNIKNKKYSKSSHSDTSEYKLEFKDEQFYKELEEAYYKNLENRYNQHNNIIGGSYNE